MNPVPLHPEHAVPRERAVFAGALECSPGPQRDRYLDDACGSDGGLRRRVEELLAAAADPGGFMDEPALNRSAPGAAGLPAGGQVPVGEQPGDRIGRYRLLEQIGEGGCGIVFMAEQEEPVRRRVALKIIKLGMDTRSVIARFEAERQALAMMDHPNIARVFDAGATDTGRPYFVMELVRGLRLTEYCDRYRLTTSNRIQLFMEVCQAVQHAHQKGIIHRDLKPSNILVTLHDGVPVPKVIDFGIAKATEQRLTEKTLFTEFRSFIGTPAYMSPEQAEMSGLDIDTRSDIYSLGVLLYEVLSGATPFDAETLARAGLDECRRTLREVDPVRPSTRVAALSAGDLTTTAAHRCIEPHRLVSLLQGDLDWIAMKCLEKDRTRRYSTANALASDLRRFLDNEPVSARPPTAAYRLGKLLRRNRLLVGAVAAVAVALVTGTAVSLRLAVRARAAETAESRLRRQAEAERARAEQESAAARLNAYMADMNLADQSLADGNFGRARQLIDRHRPQPGDPDLRGFEWRHLWLRSQGDPHVALPAADSPVQTLAFSPDGRAIAAGLRETIRIYDLGTRTIRTTLPRGAVSVAFLPDGARLVSASRSSVRFWNLADGSEVRAFDDDTGPLALSADGTRLAALARGGVRVRDTADGREVRLLPELAAPFVFSPDGRLLAATARSGVGLWRVSDGARVAVLEDSADLRFARGPGFIPDRALVFSPDGRFLAAARNAATHRGVFVVSLWDAETGREVGTLPRDAEQPGHLGVVAALVFAPDGQTLASSGWDHLIRVWDPAGQRRVGSFLGHRNEVWSLAFSPDGHTLASGSKDGGVHLWPARSPRDEERISGVGVPLGVSPDSRTLLTATSQGTVTHLNLSTREPERQHAFKLPPSNAPEAVLWAASADQRILASASAGTVRLVDLDSEEVRTSIRLPGRTDFLTLSPDGHILLTGGWEQPVTWWEPASGTTPVLTLDARRALFSADGRVLAALGPGRRLEIWDTASRSRRRSITAETPIGFGAALSADGALLATAGNVDDTDNRIELWDTATGRAIGRCLGHKQPVLSLAFAPDGRTLASSGADSTVKLWNVATLQEVLSVRRPGESLWSLLFSPDGRHLVGTVSPGKGAEPGLRLFRAASLSEVEAAESARP